MKQYYRSTRLLHKNIYFLSCPEMWIPGIRGRDFKFFDPLTYKWIDLGYVLSLTGQTGMIRK